MASNGQHGDDIRSTSPAQPTHLSKSLPETVSTNVPSSRFTHFVNSHQGPAYISQPEPKRTRATRKRTRYSCLFSFVPTGLTQCSI